LLIPKRLLLRMKISCLADTGQINATNSQGIDNPFRVFEGKYSILIDMSELEATMSEHPITMIARGMHRLPTSNEPARDMAIPRKPFVALLPSECISVLLMAQKPGKMATTA
jgi:hypothetical protein